MVGAGAGHRQPECLAHVTFPRLIALQRRGRERGASVGVDAWAAAHQRDRRDWGRAALEVRRRVNSGACGIGSLMSTVSTSFAGSAFNVVDRTCAVGNLSYVHEVGHNQGLHHDPANASSTPSYPYAYGYQDPSGIFRTVMSYGGAVRIAYMSSPNNVYNGVVTGTASQDNVRALNGNVATVAAFKSTGGGSTPPPAPTCTYSVSTTSLSFAATGGSKSVSVTAPTGCNWSTANDAAATWVATEQRGWLWQRDGDGDGSANTGAARSTT